MKCPLSSEQTAELLLDYSAGRLDAARRVTLEQHMKGCVPCSGFREEQASLWAALDSWEPEPVSSGFNRSLWQRIDAAAAAPWYRKLAGSLSLGGWKHAFPLAAALLIVAAGFVLDHRGAGQASGTGMNGAAVSIMEADQVEKTLDEIQLLKQFDAAFNGSTASTPL